MSAPEESIKQKKISGTKSESLIVRFIESYYHYKNIIGRFGDRVINRVVEFLSSVQFGIVLLCILVALSMIGMLIIQQNVQGFDSYYASLTPAEKTVFAALGFFDIYYSWYYSFLLFVLSLNIILASIDRFPGAWKYITNPKLTATPKWLRSQNPAQVLQIDFDNDKQIAEKISGIFKKNGFSSKISEENQLFYPIDENGNKDFQNIQNKKYTLVFGESGRWNRMGAYIVHVFLLILFLGHLIALQTGFDADVRLTPDSNPSQQEQALAPKVTDQIQLIQFNLDKQERYNVQLPFTITCTEIEQKLIDPNGSIEINNTLDWRTQIKIDDPDYGSTVADVSLNKPFEYRGYRFFQASAITIGSASEMTLNVIPQTEGAQPLEVKIKRNETVNLPDGTIVKHEMFLPDFAMQGNQLTTRSADYNNPVAVLSVTPPNGQTERVFAFANKLPDNAPINAPKAGYRWRMASFEKSPIAHVLSIKYDPFNAAFIAWYIGGFGLIGALAFVFFVSHRRIWALIDSEKNEIVFGGNANRNQFGFEDKFNKIVSELNPNARPATEES